MHPSKEGLTMPGHMPCHCHAGSEDKMRLTPGIEARLQQMQQSYQQLSDVLAEGEPCVNLTTPAS
jgi:hypothetical protein